MRKLRVGQKVRMLHNNLYYYSKGDIGTIVTGSVFHRKGEVTDGQGDYWADFHDNGNPRVHDYRHICIGKPGVEFVLVQEEANQ